MFNDNDLYIEELEKRLGIYKEPKRPKKSKKFQKLWKEYHKDKPHFLAEDGSKCYPCSPNDLSNFMLYLLQKNLEKE